jgi:hypothetical protein
MLVKFAQDLQAQKDKVIGWKLYVVKICKNLMQAILDSFKSNQTEQEFKKTCENIFYAGWKAIRTNGEESPTNLVKFFKQFRNLKSTDLDLEYEYAEKLIKKAGSYKNAKDIIEWMFTADPPEFADSAKRPWHMFEVFSMYSLYLKYNDKAEQRRLDLIKKHYAKEK